MKHIEWVESEIFPDSLAPFAGYKEEDPKNVIRHTDRLREVVHRRIWPCNLLNRRLHAALQIHRGEGGMAQPRVKDGQDIHTYIQGGI